MRGPVEHAVAPADDQVAESSDQLQTVDWLARKLNVKRSWVYSAVASGKLPHVRIGKYLRFRPDQVSAFLQSHSRGA